MSHSAPTVALLFLLSFPYLAEAIQCYSGSQLQIIECPSVSCIKQSLGLDTVRYCDGTGHSSICQTYGLTNSCQNLPNMGHICCCGDQLCNSAMSRSPLALTFGVAIFLLLLRFAR